MALYQVFYYGAVHRVGAAIASLVTLCSAPAGVATLSAVLLRERLNLGVVLALVMALAGTALLVGPPTDVGADRQIALVGVAFAFGAGASYAVLTVASRALAAGLCHPLGLIVVGFGGGALLLLPFALADGFGVFHSWTAWLLLLYLGFVPAALAYALFFSGLRSTSATVASVVSLLEPLTATCLAWLIFGERLGVLGIVGASLLLGGLLVLYRNTRARSPGA